MNIIFKPADRTKSLVIFKYVLHVWQKLDASVLACDMEDLMLCCVPKPSTVPATV